jgi:uncharacterized membrane protein YhaH (DUF805 family)
MFALDKAHPLAYRYAVTGIKKFFTYEGRVGRLTFLLSFLLVNVVTIMFFMSPEVNEYQFFVEIVFFYTFFSLPAVKRFHDLDMAGFYFFALFVPFYNIYLFARLLFQRGTIGANEYGEDPVSQKQQG